MCPVGYGVHSSAAEILTKRWHGSVARPSAVFPRRQAECLFPAEPCAQLSGPRRRGGQPCRVAGHSAPRLPMSALVPYKPFSASSRFRKASIDRAIALLYTLFFFFFLASFCGWNNMPTLRQAHTSPPCSGSEFQPPLEPSLRLALRQLPGSVLSSPKALTSSLLPWDISTALTYAHLDTSARRRPPPLVGVPGRTACPEDNGFRNSFRIQRKESF